MKNPIATLLTCAAGALLLVTASGCAHNQPAATPPVVVAPEPQPEFVYLTKANLEAEVLNSPLPVLLYVCHKDQGACKMEEPILRKVALAYQDRIKFARVEMKDQMELGIAMGGDSKQNLPLHYFVLNGKPLGSYAGILDADELKKLLDKLLQASKPPAEKSPSL
jgi:thioredoxin-like negative regulator of GroEL